jgi:histidine ammonia-lyase
VSKHQIDKFLTLENIYTLQQEGAQVELSKAATARITKSREFLENKLKNNDKPIYGINTGFGSLYKNQISNDELNQLQYNLLVSHACGTGDEVPQEIVKLMLVLKAQSLSYGYSGVQLETVQRLIDYFNHDITPVVYQQGSLGASGDLAPLAHLSLPLLGEGEIYHKGKKLHGSEANKIVGKPNIVLQAKEGIGLINGTQFMSAYGCYTVLKAQQLTLWADTIAAVSFEAFNGNLKAFDKRIARIRPHEGHMHTATYFNELLLDSEIVKQDGKAVQDPYSFRCIPQVHGASKDALAYIKQAIHTEINSVTDNPLIFPDEGDTLSGGNFHGQPIALPLDYMAIATAELGNISERRTYLLVSGQRGLPEFLVANPGVNSGFMIPQYTAASMVSQNKQYCTPASVDSITSSNGQEDHVSMGANAATKAYKVVQNVERILAIELFTAMQALDFRKDIKSSTQIEKLRENYRKVVPFVEDDTYMHPHIDASIKFMQK